MAKQYNYCLDFVKGIACICVVLMHCEFPGLLGIAVQAVSRFSVPFFFMVSGYFCFSESGKVNVSKKIGHIFRICLYACVFYTCFMLLFSLFQDVDWAVSKVRFLRFLFFNTTFWPGIAGQYWFLFALLYVYLFYGLIERLGAVKWTYWLAILLLVLYFTLAQGAHLLGYSIPNFFYRNWLIEGVPYFMMGHFIHANVSSLKISNKYLLLTVLVSTLLCLVERYLLGRDFGVNMMSFPQVIALFLYAVNNPYKHKGLIQEIGKRCSMLVYILHPAVWHSMDLILEFIGLSDNIFALYMGPVAVILLSLLIACFIDYIKSKKDNRIAV